MLLRVGCKDLLPHDHEPYCHVLLESPALQIYPYPVVWLSRGGGLRILGSALLGVTMLPRSWSSSCHGPGSDAFQPLEGIVEGVEAACGFRSPLLSTLLIQLDHSSGCTRRGTGKDAALEDVHWSGTPSSYTGS